MAFDPSGILYVADTGHHRIVKLYLPTSTSASPGFHLIKIQANGQTLLITWEGRSDRRYAVQSRDSLEEGIPWAGVAGASGLQGRDGSMSWTDTGMTGCSVRVYRVIAY